MDELRNELIELNKAMKQKIALDSAILDELKKLNEIKMRCCDEIKQ